MKDKGGWLMVVLAVIMSPMAVVVGLFAVITGLFDNKTNERLEERARLRDQARIEKIRSDWQLEENDLERRYADGLLTEEEHEAERNALVERWR